MPTLTTPPWLEQVVPHQRSVTAQQFYNAVRSGLTDPQAILAHVVATVHRRLQWATDPPTRLHWQQVLTLLHADPQAAAQYALSVLANEQLPREERERQKRENAKPFILAGMKGKPATDAQHWRLRKEGYTGPLPTDKAEASQIIDRLLTEQNTSSYRKSRQ